MKQQVNINEFRDAIVKGDLERVMDLVQRGADINAIDEYMIPMFVHAINSNSKEMAIFFFDQGADVNPQYPYVSVTSLGAALAMAATAESTDKMDYTFGLLLQKGANPNPTNTMKPPLTCVIEANGPCSEILLKHLVKNCGAEINPTADNVTPPLVTATQVACHTGNFELFFTCLGLGAEINSVTSGAPPLVAAISSGGRYATIIAKYLINNGANLESDVINTSPLHQAAMVGNQEICGLLIEKGADVNKSFTGDVSLFEFLIRCGNLDMLQYLMGKGMKLCWDKALEISLNNQQPSGIEMTKFLLSEAEKDGHSYDERELVVKAINNHNKILSDFLIEQFGSIDLSDYQGYFNLSTFWSRDMVIKLNHPLSKILQAASQAADSSDINEVFQTAETIISTPNIDRGNLNQILGIISQNKASELVQKILKDNSGDSAKAIKTLTLFQLKHTFKNDKFVLTTTNYGNEAGETNTHDIKEKSKTYIKGGKICFSYSQETVSDGEGYIYVVSKKGDLYLGTSNNFKGLHHSFFLKGKPGQEHYGYGKPVACGGHITLKDGLIAKIDSHSGHYSPTLDQLKLVCKHFKDLGMLAKDVIIETYNHEIKIDSDSLDSMVIGDILAQYPDLAGG